MREVAIVGVGIHKFGRFPDKRYTDLGSEATLDALKDAGIEWSRIEAAFCGTVYCGSTAGAFTLAEVGLTGIPIIDLEMACAASGAAVMQACRAIATGVYDVVLALGFDKMPRGFIPSPRFQDWERKVGLAANPIAMALAIQRHMYEYGTTADQLVKVSVKAHKNGALNPEALYQKSMTYEEIAKSAMVCDPLRLFMLCAPDDGAGAAILCSKDKARTYTTKPIIVAASEMRSALTHFDLAKSPIYATGETKESTTKRAAQAAYEVAGIGPGDLDVVELQDTDSGSEIIAYEELGLCKKGEGGRLIEEGATEISGRIPVNASGGLICKGEPVGASQLGQIHELVLQLRDQAGPRQVKNPKVGLSHVLGAGGNSAVAILKK